MVRMNTLIKVAAFGGVITIGTGVYLQQALQQRVRNTEVYRGVVRQVLQNRGFVSFLGEPVKFGSIDVSNSDNYCYSNKAHIKVPIKGSNTNGILEFWAEKPSGDTTWTYNAIEVDINDDQGGRINILRQETY